jgi:DNA-binding MarR family transcriptional regulator
VFKHQLLLAIRGHPDPAGPTVGDLADHLVLRHHSAVELIDRAARDGLVERHTDTPNKSVVHVTLTPVQTAKLEQLTEAHGYEPAKWEGAYESPTGYFSFKRTCLTKRPSAA